MANLEFQTIQWNNCGSYRDGPHEINLNNPGQLIYVTGENKVNPELGSNDIGKSTFINIFYWCLTGKTLRSSRPGAAIEPWNSDDASWATLDFIKDGTPHAICRMRNPNSLTLDTETATQDRVFETLGLSEEAITNTIIIGQFNPLFMNLRPEQQSSLFAELLNLDLWADCVEACSTQIRNEDRNIDDYNTKISRDEGALGVLETQIKETRNMLWEFDNAQDITLNNLHEKLDSFGEEYDQLLDDLVEAGVALKSLPNIEEQEKEVKSYRQVEILAQQNVSKSEVIKASRERELTDVEHKLKQYRETNNLCPACGQAVGQDHIDEVITGLAVRKRGLLDTIEASQQTLRQYQRDLKSARDSIAKLDEALGDSREQIRKHTEHYNSCSIQEAKKKMEVAQIQDEITKATTSINPYISILDTLTNRQSATQSSLDKSREDLSQSEKLLGHLKIWLDGFKQIRLNLIDETLDELEITSNKHAARLGLDGWEIGLYTERETKKGDIQHKFTVNTFSPETDKSVPIETIGGGVTTRLQLALFFGLSEILLARAGILPNIEMLDEPTRHLSGEGIEDLLECLRERAQETGRSIYLIDHNQLDRGDFDKVLWIEKTEEGSRIVG